MMPVSIETSSYKLLIVSFIIKAYFIFHIYFKNYARFMFQLCPKTTNMSSNVSLALNSIKIRDELNKVYDLFRFLMF